MATQRLRSKSFRSYFKRGKELYDQNSKFFFENVQKLANYTNKIPKKKFAQKWQTKIGNSSKFYWVGDCTF